MNTAIRHTKIEELIASLEKAAPRSCSKPKSEMCSKCIDRLYGDRALQIQSYIKELKGIQTEGKMVPATLETAIIELLNT